MFKISNNLNYKKISIKVSAVILILFPIFIIIGLFSNLFISILIYLLIALTPIGIIGGIWLWEYLGTSEMFKKGLSIFPKIVGLSGVIALGIFVVAGFYVSFNGDFNLINQIVQMGTKLMWFMCWYFVGYLISIWKPKERSPSQEKQKFKIKWKISLQAFGILGIYCGICLGILYIIYPTNFLDMLPYLLVVGIGFTLGWIFWEHLGELDLIKGDFQKVLKIISVISFIPLIILVILGLLNLNSMNFELNRLIVLGYALFIYLMFTYFLGLFLSVIRK